MRRSFSLCSSAASSASESVTSSPSSLIFVFLGGGGGGGSCHITGCHIRVPSNGVGTNARREQIDRLVREFYMEWEWNESEHGMV